MPALHPDAVLLDGMSGLEWSACEHYAGDEKKLRKALALQRSLRGAFDVTADLEDGARSGQEDALAQLLCGLLAQEAAPEGRVGCRVHPVDHPAFKADIRTLFLHRPVGLAYITLPKVTGLAQLSEAAQIIARESLLAGYPKAVPIQVLIEDEAALHQVFELAAHPQVCHVSFGQMDFTSSHGGAIAAQAMKSPGQFDHPLMRRAKLEISAACHAHGKVPTHNPTTDYASPVQAAEDARRARHEFGFTRMWSIHPGQIEQILSAFSPATPEIQDASRILLAAQRADWGPIADQGLLHDRASYRYYWQLLKRVRANGGVIPAPAEEAFFRMM